MLISARRSYDGLLNFIFCALLGFGILESSLPTIRISAEHGHSEGSPSVGGANLIFARRNFGEGLSNFPIWRFCAIF